MFRVGVVDAFNAVIAVVVVVADAFGVSFVVWACLALLFCVEQTRIRCYNPHGLHVCLAPTQRMRQAGKKHERTGDSI